MTERPLMFSTPMVQAILAGRKICTRRLGTRYDKWQVGDTLWVKETYQTTNNLDGIPPSGIPSDATIHYKADGLAPVIMGEMRSAMFMPRHVARIVLPIVSIRKERLQAITHEDAWNEGFEPAESDTGGLVGAWQMFAQYWDSLNGKKDGCSWADNPYVTRIEFAPYAPVLAAEARR